MKTYIELKRDTANSVDELLKKKLSAKEYRTLTTLVRANRPWSMKGIMSMESVIHIAKHQSKNLITAKEIVALYRLADIPESDWNTHWVVINHDQKEISKEYKSMARPPRQDNKTYLNKQNTWGAFNKNKIRYPRKKRKTAWKRFYKLFPHLKPEENDV
jgi:hypothetical protein